MSSNRQNAPLIRTLNESMPKPLIDSTLSVDGVIDGGDAFADYGIDDVTYKGYSLSVGVDTDKPFWRIERIKKVGNVLMTEYANGTMEFVNIWDDRASYSYSR